MSLFRLAPASSPGPALPSRSSVLSLRLSVLSLCAVLPVRNKSPPSAVDTAFAYPQLCLPRTGRPRHCSSSSLTCLLCCVALLLLAVASLSLSTPHTPAILRQPASQPASQLCPSHLWQLARERDRGATSRASDHSTTPAVNIPPQHTPHHPHRILQPYQSPCLHHLRCASPPPVSHRSLTGCAPSLSHFARCFSALRAR